MVYFGRLHTQSITGTRRNLNRILNTEILKAAVRIFPQVWRCYLKGEDHPLQIIIRSDNFAQFLIMELQL